MSYFTCRKELHHKVLGSKIHEFKSLQEENESYAVGWVFNPKDLKSDPEPTPEVVQEDEQKAEETPEIVTTDSAETITQDEVIEDNYICDICGKECKGSLSLRMHKLHKHKVK